MHFTHMKPSIADPALDTRVSLGVQQGVIVPRMSYTTGLVTSWTSLSLKSSIR